MNAQTVSLIAGVVLSLIFSYVPGLNKRFVALQPDRKRLIMLASLAVAALGVFAVACSGLFDVGVACDQAGAVELGVSFILAMVANQTMYAISPGAKGA